MLVVLQCICEAIILYIAVLKNGLLENEVVHLSSSFLDLEMIEIHYFYSIELAQEEQQRIAGETCLCIWCTTEVHSSHI